MSHLNALYVVLSICGVVVVLLGGLWRITGAAHKLIAAISENSAVTARLSRKLSRLDRRTDRRLDDHDQRLALLEGGTHATRQPAADPRPAHRRARRPGPDRGRRVGPV